MSQVQNPSLSLLFILSPLNLLVFLSTSLVLFISYLILYYRFLHPLRHFPGPFLASITRLWIAYHNLLGDECAVFSALHHKHGPVIRITPTMLLISDATQLPEVYSRQANKSNHYITGSFGKTESLFNMQEHKQHARFRKIAAGPYGLGNVRKMEVLIDEVIGHWIERLETKFAKDGEKFDFAPWVCVSMFDLLPLDCLLFHYRTIPHYAYVGKVEQND
ncbi:hypothetical protein J1614_008474 [Plenodomus biglobosus]|nr:hypothetical protein J1614_008474 [Plenodomus biglobosus]